MNWDKAKRRSIQSEEISKDRYRRSSKYRKATDKQKRFMESLEIEFNDSISSKKASIKIKEALAKKKREKR